MVNLFWPLMTGKSLVKKKELVFCSGRQGVVMKGNYKLYYSEGQYELYDIEDDPYEKYNLAKQLPDITKRLCKVFVDTTGKLRKLVFPEKNTAASPTTK